MHPSLRFTALAFAIAGFTSVASAQTLVGAADSIYTWRGALPARALLTVKNYNGPIDVRPATGTQVEMRA